MFVVKKQEHQTYSLPVKELSADELKALHAPLAQRIVSALALEPNYSKALAKQLKEHEQKIYYHLRKLESAGIVRVVKKEPMGGPIAVYYGLSEPSFLVRFGEFKKQATESYVNESEFLLPFIVHGELQATIVVGSPDPHGPEKARSRDGYYGMDFALFLGTYLNRLEQLRVKLDTEVNTDVLQDNLILIGGPIVNHTTSLVNKHLPIRFVGKDVYSTLSKKTYTAEEIGIVVKAKNPFNPDKRILVLAGMRHSGTRATILSFLQEFDSLEKSNSFKKNTFAHVVEGVDKDYDGVVDGVEVLE